MDKRKKDHYITNLIESIPFIVVFGAVIAGIYLSHHIDIKPKHTVGSFEQTETIVSEKQAH